MKLDKKFAEALTDALINKIKAIEVEHHEVPWFDNVGMRPKNLDGKAYKGLNKLLISMLDGGREVPVYMTFLRAKQEGLLIRKGEKSLPVQYANKVAFHKETKKSISIDKYEKLSATEKEKYDVAFMMKHYDVFNVEQTNMEEVKPELYQQLKEEAKLEQRVVQETDSHLLSIVDNQSWYTPIKLDRVDRAYYSPSQDEIHLPKREFFKSDDLFYSTMLHEMSHSTGHESRLNREIHNEFGSPKYAREELVAELSAAIVGQQYGVSKTILEGNAHYLHNWLDAIKQEPEFLNEILGDVIEASDMILKKVDLEQNISLSLLVDSVRNEENKNDYLETNGIYSKSRENVMEKLNIQINEELLVKKLENKLRKSIKYDKGWGDADTEINRIFINGKNTGLIMFKSLSNIFYGEVEYNRQYGDLHHRVEKYVGYTPNTPERYLIAETAYLRSDPEYLNSLDADTKKDVDFTMSIVENTRKEIKDSLLKKSSSYLKEIKDSLLKKSSSYLKINSLQREYSTDRVKSPTINYEAVPVVEVYSDERLMTTAFVSQRNLSLPSDIISSIEDREQVLKELEVTYSPDQEKEFLEKKMRLEDDIRSKIRIYLATNYLLNLSPSISYEEKMKSLGHIKSYVALDTSEQRILHDGLHDKLPVVVTVADTEANRNKLDDNYIEYEIVPSNGLRYKGVARLQEGYTLDNTPSNVAFLEDNGISYSNIKGRKLFVSLRSQKIALLLASTALLSPVIGLAVMYAMNKQHILDKLLADKQFSKEDAEKLNRGETLRKETVENGRKIEKYYFIDSDTNKLRSIPVREVQIPHRISGVELSVKELDDLRNGKSVTGYDEASGKYYEAKLNLNNKKTIDMGFKELKAEKEFKYVPKPNSPDADKIAYVQAHGAQGVNDIWEMGGVNLERDSFLDKYDVEGFYKDYLSANQEEDYNRAKDLSETIQNSVSRQQSLSISR